MISNFGSLPLQFLGPINLGRWRPFEVDVLKSNTTIIWTSILEWYVVTCGSKVCFTRATKVFKKLKPIHMKY
jgi:hypothetical protein